MKIFSTLLASTILVATYSNASAATTVAPAKSPALDTSKYSVDTGYNAKIGDHGVVNGVNGLSTTYYQDPNASFSHVYWKNIDTTKDQSLNFVVSGKNSVVLNDVTSGQVTNFMGILNSNVGSPKGDFGGHIVIKNDAGLIFGAGSVVNVGSLAATTASTVTKNADGTFTFKDFNNDASISMNGTVNASDGYVFAMAKVINVGDPAIPFVSNYADIESAGVTDLEAGSKSYLVDLKGDGKITYSTGTLDMGKVNVYGTVNAQGNVIIRARANDIASSAINLDGLVDAGGLNQDTNVPHPKTITLDTTGTIDISSSGSATTNGGDININATSTFSNEGTISSANSSFYNHQASNDGGNITIVTGDSIDNTGTIDSSSQYGDGGDISLKTTILGYISNNGMINSSSSTDKTEGFSRLDAGNVTLNAIGDVAVQYATDANGEITSTGTINANSYYGKGGDVTITAHADKAKEFGRFFLVGGTIDSDSTLGTGGNVTVNADNEVVLSSKPDGNALGLINASGGRKGGNVSVTTKSAADVEAFNIDTSSSVDLDGTQTGGNISIQAADSIIVGNGSSFSTEGVNKAGNLTLKANILQIGSGDIDDVENKYAVGSDKTGGNVTFSGKSVNYLSGVDTVYNEIKTGGDFIKVGTVKLSEGGSFYYKPSQF